MTEEGRQLSKVSPETYKKILAMKGMIGNPDGLIYGHVLKRGEAVRVRVSLRENPAFLFPREITTFTINGRGDVLDAERVVLGTRVKEAPQDPVAIINKALEIIESSKS